MKTHIFEILALSAAILSSCTKEGVSLSSQDEIVVIPSMEETRAVLIPGGNLTGNRIHVDGYFTDTPAKKHLNANILYDEGAWVFYTDLIKGVHYYWPQKSKLDFFAYSPVKLENTCVTVTSSKTIACTNLPMKDVEQKGSLLNEFVCGYLPNRTQKDGAITMTLKRPFAVVNFYLEDAVRSTLNYIKITGLYNTGNYDASTCTWSGLSNKADLLCTVGKAFPTEINTNSCLSDSLLVIPQSMRLGDSTNGEVKLIFSYRSDKNTTDTITETTLGQAASQSTSKKVSVWEPGKVYNYYVSLNGDSSEIRMNVKVDDWSCQGTSDTDVK